MDRDDFNKEKDFETTENERNEADLSADLGKQLKEVAGTAKKLFAFQKEKIAKKASEVADTIDKDEILGKAKSAYDNLKGQITNAFANVTSTYGASKVQADLENILAAAKSADLNNEYSKAIVTYVLLSDGTVARIQNITLTDECNSKFNLITIEDGIAYFKKADCKVFFCSLEDCNSIQVDYEPSYCAIFLSDTFVLNKITVSVNF